MGRGFPGGPVSKETMRNTGDSGLILGQEDLLEKEMATCSNTCLGKSHGQRSLEDFYIFHKVCVSFLLCLINVICFNKLFPHHYNNGTAAAAAKTLQSCPTLCNPIDGSPPGSPIPGILQARTLEWVLRNYKSLYKVGQNVVVSNSRG